MIELKSCPFCGGKATVQGKHTETYDVWANHPVLRAMFFGEDERVMQFHPPKSEYINNYPYCLRLWKPVDTEIPHPPMICV